jgi:hypothetical protein
MDTLDEPDELATEEILDAPDDAEALEAPPVEEIPDALEALPADTLLVLLIWLALLPPEMLLPALTLPVLATDAPLWLAPLDALEAPPTLEASNSSGSPPHAANIQTVKIQIPHKTRYIKILL